VLVRHPLQSPTALHTHSRNYLRPTTPRTVAKNNEIRSDFVGEKHEVSVAKTRILKGRIDFPGFVQILCSQSAFWQSIMPMGRAFSPLFSTTTAKPIPPTLRWIVCPPLLEFRRRTMAKACDLLLCACYHA